MAAVRIDSVAFADPRIALLGTIAGYNQFEALGRLAHLWSACTERESAVLPESFVRGALGAKGVEALVESGLGELVPDGCRVRGCEGRTDWLGSKRRASKAGGEANKRKFDSQTKPEGSQKGAETEPKGSPLTLTLPLTLTPTLAPTLAPTVDATEPKKRFVKPTIEEVKAYCQERSNRVDPQRFVDHYESNGWRVGANPMKDWKAAVRTWEKNAIGPTSKTDQTRAAFTEFLRDEPQ